MNFSFYEGFQKLVTLQTLWSCTKLSEGNIQCTCDSCKDQRETAYTLLLSDPCNSCTQILCTADHRAPQCLLLLSVNHNDLHVQWFPTVLWPVRALGHSLRRGRGRSSPLLTITWAAKLVPVRGWISGTGGRFSRGWPRGAVPNGGQVSHGRGEWVTHPVKRVVPGMEVWVPHWEVVKEGVNGGPPESRAHSHPLHFHVPHSHLMLYSTGGGRASAPPEERDVTMTCAVSYTSLSQQNTPQCANMCIV